MVSQSGKRLITATDVFKAVGRIRRGEVRVKGYPAFIGAKNLIPYIDDKLKEKMKPIKYKAKNGRIAEAYDSTIIPDVADLYIEAYEHNSLTTNQMKTYKNSLIIVRSLAKLGINALIDEATGFQDDREGQALQRLLHAYISEDLMKWQKRFPTSFYEQVYRLRGWKFDPNNPKRPGYVGQFTNKYVYGVFPKKVLNEIKRRNPPKFSSRNIMYRGHKHFQYLTQDIGIDQLDSQLKRLTVVMQMSDNMEDFRKNFDKVFAKDLERKRIADDEENGIISLFEY